MIISNTENPLASIVCGFERGGTTLLSEILRQHPLLDSGFECGFLLGDKVSDFLNIEPYLSLLRAGWMVEDDDIEYISQASSWTDAYDRLRQRSRIVNDNSSIFDKTPAYMPILSDVLRKVPDVPCLVIVRDPRSVLWSRAKRSGLNQYSWQKKLLYEECDRYLFYARGYKQAIQDGFASQILLVQYEKLCHNPIDECQKIMQFLDLKFDPSYISFKQGAKFDNVYGNKVSSQYSNEYDYYLSPENCQRILDLTSEFSEWHYHAISEFKQNRINNNNLECIDVVRLPENYSDFLWGFHIDTPITGDTIHDGEHINLSGWILGKMPAKSLTVMSGNQIVVRVSIEAPRLDVSEIFPEVLWADNCGFVQNIPINQIIDNKLLIYANFPNQGLVPIAMILFTSIED